jgi:peptide deformylase
MRRELLRMGNPQLRAISSPVTPDWITSQAGRNLMDDLVENMEIYGGIGLAAPQIGIPLQAAVIKLSGTNRYQQDLQLETTFFFNPKVTVLSDSSQGFWEGCLSVPGLRGFVERPQHIRVEYLDHKGQEATMETKTFLSTVIQHELDHLFGILYVDKIKDKSLLTFEDEFKKYHIPPTDQVLDD